MPFRAIPGKNFVNRERELAQLRRLADLSEGLAANHVFLHGARGIGKTELLKQLYGALFRETGNVVPFYYAFQRATLKASSLAKDYFSAFLRQYLAYKTKDPAIIENLSVPLSRLMPRAASLGLHWLVDLLEDFGAQLEEGDAREQILAALSAPVVAAGRGGLPVLVMLDNFQLAARIYAGRPGDSNGLVTLFGSPMRTQLTPHILAGAPAEATEAILGDEAFRGEAERLKIGELQENEAFGLFQAYCLPLGLSPQDDIRPLMQFLGGNPLYIRKLTKALGRLNKAEITSQDFWECYSREVSEGEIAFYWSSVFGEFLQNVEQRRLILQILMQAIDAAEPPKTIKRLAAVYARPESTLGELLAALQDLGVLQPSAAIKPAEDYVLHDFIRALYLREIEDRNREFVLKSIQGRYAEYSRTSAFEMSIPMESDAELVAAKAIEQICSNISLNSDIVSPLQLALIEACINAKEHSGSYDKNMSLRFNIQPERIEIAVESPGKAFVADAGGEPRIEDKLNSDDKRGWGLKLMRELMDEVRVESHGNNTRVVLVKEIPEE